MSASPENYVLGKGVVYFNRQDLDTGLYSGELDLGNAPAFSFNAALEKMEHYSSRGGLKSKDKNLISQITPACAFTLDEITPENMSLLTLGDIQTVTQAAGSAIDEVVVVHLDRRAQLAKRNIGLTTITHGTVTSGPFTTAMTVTGGTSTATGKVVVVGSGFIQVAVTSGTFANAETITSGSTSAVVSAVPVFVPGVASVKNTGGTVTYIAGTDYEIVTAAKDDTIGRINFLSGGTVAEGESVKVTYGYTAASYQKIAAFKQTQVEGFLRFVSDNPAGTQQELQIWRVSLTPTGDTAMIGDSWSTIGFTGEILKDSTNHPDSPYFDILFDE